jgi:hypothetical protein
LQVHRATLWGAVPPVLVKDGRERPRLDPAEAADDATGSVLMARGRAARLGSADWMDSYQKERKELHTLPLLQWINIGWFRLSRIVVSAATTLSSGTAQPGGVSRSSTKALIRKIDALDTKVPCSQECRTGIVCRVKKADQRVLDAERSCTHGLGNSLNSLLCQEFGVLLWIRLLHEDPASQKALKSASV